MSDLVLWLALGVGIAVYSRLLVSYARVNYPDAWQWRSKLFFMGGFVMGVACMLSWRLDVLPRSFVVLMICIFVGESVR